MIEAAGVIIEFGDPPRVLLVRRSEGGDHAGEWCYPGGKIEDGESAEDAARRECEEEIGYTVPDGLAIVAESEDAGVLFTTFRAKSDDGEFTPDLNDEHTEFQWAEPTKLPEPMHPGAAMALRVLYGSHPGMTELEAARQVRDGHLPSPWRFGNMTLFDLRISGTGVSYRRGINEFVWRDPKDWLSEEFIKRSYGLPVIMVHPKSDSLTSEDFRRRIVGVVFLPYVKGTELWGVVKIYDDAAIEMLTKGVEGPDGKMEKLSTSPGVVFREPRKTNDRVEIDGETLLIEGIPSILDHLAIVEAGVWDKSGAPTGVAVNIKNGDDTMTEEERLAAEAKAKTDAEDKARADADGGAKLDKILACVDGISSGHADLVKRMDAMEGRFKKDAEPPASQDDPDIAEMPEETAADKARKDSARRDRAAFKDSEKRRMDAEETARKDAEGKDRKLEEERVADRARIDALEGKIPAEMADDERSAMADAQARADSVAMAFGSAAPRPLVGERLQNYRRRLLTGYQDHSETFKGVDLATITDKVAFDAIEKSIYADAAKAARNPVGVPDGTLRPIVNMDDAGRRVTTFVGSPDAWMRDFKVMKRRLTGINKGA